MKFLKLVVAWSFFLSLGCLWILHFIHNDEISKISSDIKEIRSTIAQQPHERNLPNAVVDTSWKLWSTDSAVVCSDGDCTKVITLYYKR